MEGNPQNGESGPSDLSGGDHAEHDLGETELGTSQALTNIVMTVQYDGGEYSGFVGPNHFYNEAKQEMLQNRGTPSVNKPKVVLKSVSNEVLRAIAIIHSYMPKGRKKKKVDSENGAENVDGTAMHDHNGEDTLPPERRFSLIASSRTDKGVHALEMACQYLSFDKEPPLNGDIDAIMDKVNRLLPDDIQVTAMIHAPRPDFHVRFHNLGKCYTYKVDLSESPNLFERKYYWQVMKDDQFRNTLMKKYNDIRKEFSFERMRQAADVIQGTHNFEGFRKKSRGNEKGINKNPICTIERVDINRDTHQPDKRFHVVVKGDRFLYKMVRGIVGHLVMVGYGIINVEDIQRILGNAEAIPEIQYAPSTGLYLTKVVFEPEVEKALAASKERRIEHLREIFRPSKVTETDMLS
ncbi:tRNA pseudouridine(38-40) synthase [Babesia ovis]|uniref:tRNA pseudouridine synthase n=1 Tax=Babesia ovis TaxID=5869 RepID=A0A9W5TC43_BABOV|nr:tRNA pseudouridine(38-40) synthase [Babesia ovis]